MGVFKNGRVEIIANDQGNRITPSYVAFTAEGERLIGDAAKNQLTSNPENTVFDAKRLIGREWSDPNVQHDIKFFPFKGNSIFTFGFGDVFLTYFFFFSGRQKCQTAHQSSDRIWRKGLFSRGNQCHGAS